MAKLLNARQKLFVAHYVATRNATKAAKAAGYGAKAAASKGSQLLRNVTVRRAIDKELAKAASHVVEQSELKAADVLAEIRKLAFVDNTVIYNADGTLKPFDQWPEANRKALAGMETEELFAGRGHNRMQIGVARKVKSVDKVRSLEMLAKHFKLLTDMVELGNKDNKPLVVLTMPSNGSEAPAEPVESKEQLPTLAAHTEPTGHGHES